MRRGRPGPRIGPLGALFIGLGSAIILIILMPGAFWWLVVGGILILIGLSFVKNC